MGLHQLTKTDLYRLAAAARIARRSTMTKAQLITAIERLDADAAAALELHYSLYIAPQEEEEAPAVRETPALVPDTEGVEYWSGRARQSHARRHESEERSDTDGFLSQWAAGQMANRYHHLATLAGRGWTWDYHALFDLDGNLVAAKYLKTRYGWSWALLESDDPHSRITGWFNESSAQDPAKARATNARKGYYLGLVRVDIPKPSPGYTPGEHYGERADGGFSRDVLILDNGQ